MSLADEAGHVTVQPRTSSDNSSQMQEKTAGVDINSGNDERQESMDSKTSTRRRRSIHWGRFMRLGPILGLLSMLGAAASLVASLGGLVASDGDWIISWSVPPATFLAIAFDAPLLVSCNSDALGDDILKTVRKERVRCGANLEYGTEEEKVPLFASINDAVQGTVDEEDHPVDEEDHPVDEANRAIGQRNDAVNEAHNAAHEEQENSPHA